MRTLSSIFSILFGFLFLGLIGFVLYQFGDFLLTVFNTLPEATRNSMVALWGSVFIAAIIFAASIRWIGRRKSEDQIRSWKASFYDRFLEVWSKRYAMLSQIDVEFDEKEADLEPEERTLLLLGNSLVIKRYAALKKAMLDNNHAEVPGKIDDLLKAMRMDIGQSNLGIPEGQLGTYFDDTLLKEEAASLLHAEKE